MDESKRVMNEQPHCVACGYPTVGISTLTCPECGADLREVGIETPAMRRRSGFGGAWKAWFSGLFLICLMVSNYVIDPNWPSMTEISNHASFNGFRSPSIGGLNLNQEQRTIHWPPNRQKGWTVEDSLRVSIRPFQGPPVVIEFDGMRHRYTVTAPGLPQEVHEGTMSLAQAECWMQAIGLNTADVGVRLDVESILDGLQSVIANGWSTAPFQPMGRSSGSGQRFSNYPMPGAALLHLLVWALIFTFGYRLWKRQSPTT